jgi:gamma-glutamyltranspeptidase/glutathione hydrolase
VLDFAQRRYGRLSRETLLEPAIRMAADGLTVTSLMRRQAVWCKQSLMASPTASALMLKNGGMWSDGDLFRQPALAATLSRMAREGIEDFYRGQIAHDIADDMRAHGGVLTEQDLAGVAEPAEKSPLTCQWQGRTVFTVAPPGGGVQVLLGLRLMERLAREHDLSAAENWYPLIGETTHTVFRLREELAIPLGELTTSRIDDLLCDEHIGELAEAILAGQLPQTAHTSADWAIDDIEEPGETTHLCTADAEGNVVSLTQSIQSLFGARAGSVKLGFLYNNYLLTCPRDSHPFQLAPGCQPRSNAAPTMVVGHTATSARQRQQAELLAIGAAGSRRITSAILQTLCGVRLRGQSLAQAVAAPRFHVKQSRNTWLERSPETESVADELAKRFRRVEFRKAHSFAMGCVQALQIAADGHQLGVADPRREGTAAAA